MRRFSAAGFSTEFARHAVLPDWWDASCAADPALLSEIEIRIARFIQAPLTLVQDPKMSLAPPPYVGAQLRRVRDISKDRLAPAIHAGLQIAAPVVRNMREPERAVHLPSVDAIEWRSSIVREGDRLLLTDVLRDLWKRGIPVVHIDVLPSPSFQGLACIVEGRPIIVIGHSLDEPSRLAFTAIHEVCHIVNGDCRPNEPVVDEQEGVSDDHAIETRADEYAIAALTGGAAIPKLNVGNFKDLASAASHIEKTIGIDAGAVVWSWARRTGDYAKAAMATKALYRAKGGMRAVREQFEQQVEVESAPESDRALLRCVYGEPKRDALTG